jgi:anti-sigma factor RsiW
MEHAYIDKNSIAERYISRRLTPEEREEFEQHLVNCQECADRIVLANMFRAQQLNGLKCADPHAPPTEPAPPVPSPGPVPPRANFREPAALVVRVKPKQLAVALAISLLALAVIVFAVLKLFSN